MYAIFEMASSFSFNTTAHCFASSKEGIFSGTTIDVGPAKKSLPSARLMRRRVAFSVLARANPHP
jgi:hypothetical protein